MEAFQEFCRLRFLVARATPHILGRMTRVSGGQSFWLEDGNKVTPQIRNQDSSRFGGGPHDLPTRRAAILAQAILAPGEPFTFEVSVVHTQRQCVFFFCCHGVCSSARWFAVDGQSWRFQWLVASVAGTATASCEMAKGGEGVEGIQCSSAARASVWANGERSTSSREAVEWRS